MILGTAVGLLVCIVPNIAAALSKTHGPNTSHTAQAILTPPVRVSTEEMGCMRVSTDAMSSDVNAQEPEAGFDWPAAAWAGLLSDSCMLCCLSLNTSTLTRREVPLL